MVAYHFLQTSLQAIKQCALGCEIRPCDPLLANLNTSDGYLRLGGYGRVSPDCVMPAEEEDKAQQLLDLECA
jgi:hypothetical protein